MMGIHHQHHDDHHRLFSSFNSGSNEEMKHETNLYHDAAITTTITSPAAGGNMIADFGFPFTSAQWKELERQAMIYKYIRDSVPVPPHLLLPIGKNLSKGEMGSIFNLNFKISNAAEPGRCKRTDGKKWRCSRDVAPNQKYCERHLHRGRPRSRKPVEIHSNESKRTRVDHHVPPHSNANTNISPIETTFFGFQSDVPVPFYKEYNRGLNWAMEEQWQHLLQKNGGLMMTEESSISHTNASVFQHDSIGELVNLVPFADFGDYRNEGFNFFVNSDVMCLENQSLMEKGLSDAWSSEDPNSNDSSILSQGNLSSPSLSLSMAMSAGAGSELNDEIGQISSLISPVWMDSCTPGGPLAEVLGGGGIAEGLD